MAENTVIEKIKEVFNHLRYKYNLSDAEAEKLADALSDENPLPTVSASDNGKVLTVSQGEWSAEEINPLPAVTASDNGKVLTVDNGEWSAEEVNALPAVTASDNGKVLTVANGEWTKGEIQSGGNGGLTEMNYHLGEVGTYILKSDLDALYTNKTYAILIKPPIMGESSIDGIWTMSYYDNEDTCFRYKKAVDLDSSSQIEVIMTYINSREPSLSTFDGTDHKLWEYNSELDAFVMPSDSPEL